MVNYFVSYHYVSRFGSGFGRVCIQRPLLQPITGISEKTLIEKNNFDQVIIINWQKFEV
jgi:hypothetical protein